jgi:GTP-binding protein
MAQSVVAIVGRPNVGKSTLFNRLVGFRQAIVRDEPGVTRDRIYARCRWGNQSFFLIDTGGLDFFAQDDLGHKVRQQAELALEESQTIILLLDAHDGPTPLDKEIVRQLWKRGKPIVVAINKVDGPKDQLLLADFYSLGLQRLFPISAEHGLGIGELMDELLKLLPPAPEEQTPSEQEGLRVAVVGRPNVGKSTLINCLLGEERILVSQEPGTTRDAIDTLVELNGNKYTLIDTAGIRRKARVKAVLEKYCAIKALKAIERSDVALILMDASQGVTEQDVRIAGYVHQAGKAAIVVMNKWDLVPKDGSTMSQYTLGVKARLKFMNYAPVVFTSALSGQRVLSILKLVSRVGRQYCRRLPTPGLNKLLQQAVGRHHPPSYKGKPVKLYYITQVSTKPPAFVVFVNYPQGLGSSYRRYLTNQIRQTFGLSGTPLIIMPRQRR